MHLNKIKFCAIYTVILLIVSETLSEEKIFGVRLDQLEEHYVELLFNAELNVSERELLSHRIGAVLFHLSIDAALAALNQSDQSEKLRTKKCRTKAEKIENLELFNCYKVISQSIEEDNAQNGMDLEGLCQLWDFEQLLLHCAESDAVANRLLTHISCSEVNNFDLQQNDDDNIPNWLLQFQEDVSRKHLDFLLQILSMKGEMPFWEWLDIGQRMRDESLLSFRLRSRNVPGRVDELIEAKRILLRHLLPWHMDTFELRLPIIAAFDVADVGTMKKTLRGIFGPSESVSFIRKLEVIVLYGRIWPYFEEHRNNFDARQFLEISWKIFIDFLAKLPEYLLDKTNEKRSDVLHNLLNNLLAHFGDLGDAGQLRQQKLLGYYEGWFVELFEEEQHFRQKCREKGAVWHWLSANFKFGTGGKPKIESKFWELFRGDRMALAGVNQPNSEPENMPTTTPTAAAAYDQCPDPHLSVEQLSEMDTGEAMKDSNAFGLALSYMTLLHKLTASESLKEPSNEESFRSLELDASIWYYNEFIRKLLEFGDSLPDKNENFTQFLDAFQNTRQLPTLAPNRAEQLCWLHQLAYSLAFGAFEFGGDQWKSHMAELVGANGNVLLGELLIVPSHDEMFQNKIYCANEEKAQQFVQKFRNTANWMRTVHCFCLRQLISRFKQVQLVFCYGDKTVCIHPTCPNNAIARLLWMVGTNVLDKLKMAMPEIMHYDILDPPIYRSSFLQQISHKTHSQMAEGYEARIITPELLKTLNEFERKFKNGKCKFPSDLCKKFLQLIVEGKNRIYSMLKLGLSNALRIVLCQLFNFNKFLAENEAKMIKSEPMKVVAEWEGCPEGTIKKAFSEARKKHQMLLFTLIEANLTSHESFREIIRFRPAFYGRLTNYLTDLLLVPKSNVARLANSTQMNNPAVFNDDESLFSNCLEALFSDNPKESMLGTFRADIIAFVRWMDSKIANSAKQNDVTILAKRLSKAWQIEGRPFFETLLGQTYDLSANEESIKYVEFVAVCEMSKDYVEKVLKSKKMKSDSVLANDWQKGIGKALELRLQFVQDDDGIVLSSKTAGGGGTFPMEFVNWLQETHRQLFWKLISENDKFSLKLKEEINSREHVERLCQFLGDETKAAEILRFLGLDEMVNIMAEIYADKSEKVENGGDKKATKKRKAKKKKGNGGNLNAIQTPILAENANFGTFPASEAAAGREENGESFKTALSGREGTELGMESEELSEISEIAKQTEEGQIAVTKIGDFADDGFLSSKYLAFIRILVLKNKGTKTENDKLLTNGLKIGDKRSKKGANGDEKYTKNSCDSEEARRCEQLEALSKLLNVGVFADEISLRLEVIRELGNDFDIIEKSERREFEQIWGKMKRQNLTKDSDWQQIGQNLHNLLKQILNAMDKVEKTLKAENIGVEMAELAKLLHFHKFARAVVDNGAIWSGLSREQRDTATLALFKAEENENGAFARKGGSNFLEKCKQMQLQRRIDKALYAQYKNDNFSDQNSHPNYCQNSFTHLPEGWQELIIVNDQQQRSKINHLLQSDDFCIITGVLNQTLEKAIDEMREIFQNWYSDAIFDISTRHLLSFQNDRIKAICILPDGFALDRVLGQEICNLESRQMCQSNSVYCHICRNANVSFLRKLWRDMVTDVPMLKITFFGIPMEILVAIVPGIGQFPLRPINARQIDTILRILAQNVDKSIRADHIFDEGIYNVEQNWHSNEMNRLNKKLQNAENGDQASEIVDKITVLNDQSEMLARERAKVQRERGEVKTWRGMLYVLGDFGTYARILHFLLNGEDESLDTNSDHKFKFDDEIGQKNSTVDKFRLIIAYLIKWAKNNHIYSDDFGYLDAKILLILLTKIFLLYPDASLPFLVQKFFLTFSAWHWPVPVQLAEIGHGRRGDFLSWTPGREWMKKRQENWGKSVQEKVPMPILTPTFPEENAAKNFNLSTAKVVQNELKKAFEKVRTGPNGIVLPLERTNFIEKYDHFIVVQCNSEHNTENVHNFVVKSLRHELLDFIENPLAEWVRFCHVLPRSFTVTECDSPDDRNGCKKRLWLIGIDLIAPQKALSQFKSKLRVKLRKKFGAKIREEFKYDNLQLQSEYVDDRQKLAEWTAFVDEQL